jgi:hypothetical protein
MDSNIVVKQMQAIMRFLMSLFYIGTGIFLLFFADNFQIDKALRNIVGAAFLFYGIYRIYTSFITLFKLFFRRDEGED